MDLDPHACYRALRARDARFDGRFFTGVVSTGVYCRPICPARTPRRDRVRFFPCAAAAQAAGFRPCLRCRPEAAPGTPAWLGTSVTVSRALRLIAAGGLDAEHVGEFASRVGVGDRHLRRLFLRHLGATPIAVAQTQRALFAKKLIDETPLPMTEVALAAGFRSLRRFNAAVRATYGRPPTALRRRRADARRAGDASDVVLRLAYRPPYAWDALLRFLRARAIPGVEAVGPDAYRRTFLLEGRPGIVEVRLLPGQNQLGAHIQHPSAAALPAIVTRLRRLFDLLADPQAIGGHLGHDPRLAPAVDALPGLRVPGAWDGFELAVRAILGQQVSVRAATTLAGRLVAAWGEPRPGTTPDDPLRYLFPRAEVLAGADLAQLGMPRARAAAIRALAAACAAGELDLEPAGDPAGTLAALRRLPGVGEWTAQYVAMRALGEPDAFPSADLGLRRAIAPPPLARDAHQAARSRPWTPSQLDRAAEAWRPWRAYAALYLWSWGGCNATTDRDRPGADR